MRYMWAGLVFFMLSNGVQAQRIPSLDDYALNKTSTYQEPTILPPSAAPADPLLTASNSRFEVLSTVALRSGSTVTIPVRGKLNGTMVNQAQLIGTFQPEGEVAGRIIFEQIITPQRTYQVQGQTDLIPGRTIAGGYSSEQQALQRQIQQERQILNQYSGGSYPNRPSNFNSQQSSNPTNTLINLAMRLLGINVNIAPAPQRRTTPGMGFQRMPYDNYYIDPNSRVSQGQALLDDYEDQMRQPQGTILVGDLTAGQTLTIAFTEIR